MNFRYENTITFDRSLFFDRSIFATSNYQVPIFFLFLKKKKREKVEQKKILYIYRIPRKIENIIYITNIRYLFFSFCTLEKKIKTQKIFLFCIISSRDIFNFFISIFFLCRHIIYTEWFSKYNIYF